MASVDVTAEVAVVVDVGRGVTVDEGLRSQGFGGDACMLNVEGLELGRRKHRQTPVRRIQSHMICYIHVSTRVPIVSTCVLGEEITAKMSTCF